MPTGYTHDVQTGKVTTLQDFARSCIRNFGIAYHMRDSATSDGLYPVKFNEEFFKDPVDSHERSLQEATAKLTELLSWTETQWAAAALEDYEKQSKDWVIRNLRTTAYLKNYNNMRQLVEKWEAPASCAAVKTFMLSQLDESIRFDCTESTEIKMLTAEEFKEKRLSSVRWSVEFHEERLKASKKRLAEAKAMHEDFISSLGLNNV